MYCCTATCKVYLFLPTSRSNLDVPSIFTSAFGCVFLHCFLPFTYLIPRWIYNCASSHFLRAQGCKRKQTQTASVSADPKDNQSRLAVLASILPLTGKYIFCVNVRQEGVLALVWPPSCCLRSHSPLTLLWPALPACRVTDWDRFHHDLASPLKLVELLSAPPWPIPFGLCCPHI